MITVIIVTLKGSVEQHNLGWLTEQLDKGTNLQNMQ
jgi:hypothetical protein